MMQIKTKSITLKTFLLSSVIGFLANPQIVYAASEPPSSNFLDSLFKFLFILAPLVAIVFIAKGGLEIVTSGGDPNALAHGKRTARNAAIGLVFVIAARVIVSIFSSIFIPYTGAPVSDLFTAQPVEVAQAESGIVSVLLEGILGFLRAVVESFVSPVIEAFVAFFTNTPSLLGNSTVVKYWLIILGITESLFVLVMILLGYNLMTGDVFGLVGEQSPKQIILRLGAGMAGAALSLFIADTLVGLANFMVDTVNQSSGGLAHSWVLNIIHTPSIGSSLAVLLLSIAYIVLAIMLIVLYAMRLAVVVAGAVFFPFIFLFLVIPRLHGFAEGLIRNYIIAVFLPFTHLVIIQLFAEFLKMPEQKNDFVSFLSAIGLFLVLLKIPGFLSTMAARGAESEVSRQMVTKISGSISSMVSSVSKSGGGAAKS